MGNLVSYCTSKADIIRSYNGGGCPPMCRYLYARYGLAKVTYFEEKKLW